MARKKLRLKQEYNNVWDTDEILWLLKGNENLTAFEFVCKCILERDPSKLYEMLEYVEED